MAPLLDPRSLRFTKFFLYYLLASSFLFVIASSHYQQQHSHKSLVLGRRNLLVDKTELIDDTNNDDEYVSLSPKKTNKSPSSSTSSKNQTKLNKSPPSPSKKNQTKLTSTTSSSKNTTKNVGASKLNSTKSLDPLKPSSSKNKTKSSSTTITKIPPSSNTLNKQQTQTQKPKPKPKSSPPPPTWMLFQDDDNNSDEQDYDFMSEIQNLPTKFHQSFVPDIHKLSTTSKMYLTKANNEITENFIKPYVGHQYASSVSTAISCAFIIVPFLLVSLIFNQITSYFSIQKLVIFVQVYLSIYFSILCLSALITGLEPLRFFYATSLSTYVWLQVLQTLGYVLYLLMLLMYLILVFSTESGLGLKFLSLAQTFVGFGVGLHYYITVFHRVVLHQPPKTNWKVHGIYATCFLVICLLARVETRKKAYLEEGGEEGKQS